MTDIATYITPSQLALRWGVKRQRVYQLIAAGRLAPVHIHPILLAGDTEKPEPSTRKRGKGKG
jgi:hypothetical protein